MPIAPQGFLYEVDEATAVATLTLNRADRLNALTFEIYEELRDTFVALSDEPGVRAVILTGSGRAFCSGGDVDDIIGALFDKDYAGLLRFTRLTGSLIGSIRRCSKPVVAALNGTVAGAGAVIAAACDFRVANQPRSASCSPRSAWPGPTWGRPGSCRGWSARAGRRRS